MPVVDLSEAHQSATSADVCVIGSGPAGGVLAVSLAEAGARVVVLEAGPRAPASPRWSGEDIRVEVASPGRVEFGALKQLGGTTAVWSGRIARLDPIDIDGRPGVDGSGWPLRSTELDPYDEAAAELLGVADLWPSFEDLPHRSELYSGAAAGLFDSGALAPRSFLWAPQPFKVAAYLEGAARRHRHLRVSCGAQVRSLEVGSGGSTVRAARVRPVSGGDIRIEADRFVVAAGGLEAALLLLRSNEVVPAGLGNDNDLVGRYLATHPKGDVARIRLAAPQPGDEPLWGPGTPVGSRAGFGIGCSSSTLSERGLLNHYLQLIPDRSRWSRIRRRLSTTFPGVGGQRHPARRSGAVRSLTVRAFLDQDPDPDNRVQVVGSGRHTARISWRLGAGAVRSLEALLALLDQELRSSGLGELEPGPRGVGQGVELTAIHSHLLGTTRMGDGPAEGVVDRHQRVFGVDNLYVAGPSVFRTYGFANPTLTIVALSLRLADHLAADG